MAPDTEVLPSEEARKWRLQPSDPVLLGLLVFYACLFGIYTRPVGFLATLWPANAVMLGILLLRPDSARASGWLAAAAAYLAADLMTGSDLTKAVLLNLANLVGVGTAYAICVRLPPNTVRLRQPGSMLYIALASAAGAAAVGVVSAFQSVSVRRQLNHRKLVLVCNGIRQLHRDPAGYPVVAGHERAGRAFSKGQGL